MWISLTKTYLAINIMVNDKNKDPFYIICAIILIGYMVFAKLLPFLYLPLKFDHAFLADNLPLAILIFTAFTIRNKIGLVFAVLMLLGFELYLLRGDAPHFVAVGISLADLYTLMIRFVLILSGFTSGAVVGHFLLPKLTHPEDKQWLNVILIFLVVGLAAFAAVLINVDKLKTWVQYRESIKTAEVNLSREISDQQSSRG